MIRLALHLIITLILAIAEIPTMPDDPNVDNPSGVSGDDVPGNPRQGSTREREAVVVSLYDDAAARINAMIGETIANERLTSESVDYRVARSAELLRRISEVATVTRSGSFERIRGMADDAYKLGDGQGVRQAAEVLPAGSVTVGFEGIDQDAINAIATDTTARLSDSMRIYVDQAQAVFRSLSSGRLSRLEPTVNRAIARGLITGDPREAEALLREQFRDPNAPELESYRKLGRKRIQVGRAEMSVAQYTQMVVRTRTREATVAGRHQRLDRNGIHTVQITGRVSRNFCTRFIGLVVSIRGGSDEYPAIASLPQGGPPFHPNCSKGTVAFVPGVSSPHLESMHRKALAAYRHALATGDLTRSLAA